MTALTRPASGGLSDTPRSERIAAPMTA